jgi:hypothetical protein
LSDIYEIPKQSDTNNILGAAANTQEEVAWDESDDEESATPKNGHTSSTMAKPEVPAPAKDDSDNATLKPTTEPRKSNDLNSSAGSEASYDIVSGATSRAPPSPTAEKKGEDSDDDWE